MYANHDEAQKCITIAKNALVKGDVEKVRGRVSALTLLQAVKFLLKAESMYPTDEAKALLAACRAKAASGSTAEASQPSSSSSRSARSGRAASSASDDRAAADGARSTAKAAALNRECLQILNSKSYYDVLGVPHNASTDDIKRAYKKLALKFHPDKNPAKRAGEAFNKISDAFQCLSDPDKRNYYDRVGSDPGAAPEKAYRARPQDIFMTPDVLFEAFFGMHPSRRAHYHRNAYEHHYAQHASSSSSSHHSGYHSTSRQSASSSSHSGGQAQGAAPTAGRIPLAFWFPFVGLLIFAFMGVFFGGEPPQYQFSNSARYSRMLSTQLNGVVYYVDPRVFERRYPPNSVDRVRLEYEVDYHYFDNKCAREKAENERKAYDYISRLQVPPKDLNDTPASCRTRESLHATYSDYLRRRTAPR
ncbi:DnaJ domain containing protein, putative [Babesia bigemina]|uniref:DnaJ domain containing protein, putative n=1 Tax=Babesia bigemina TaxID=5866 RepID=A0A061D3M5_BABBI|nr:DnaJ domain containing protein, putative [Babesia bigemina]CDR94677.1 DnaJ domain containing protein, putative [Babesia bigemina]|eukprot:XP_012766863.1 DnaJ domain containing protein, putative [Babesia bigemina]